MTTNFQQARQTLGARLRELRADARLRSRELAVELGWPQSKVSKLETGRQTPSPDDLTAWANATGQPDVAEELRRRLRTLESHYAAWRRQLAAGNRARQQAWGTDETNSTEIYNFETGCVPGLLQTADYARAMFTRVAEIYSSPPDIDASVEARTERQRILHEHGRQIHVLVAESALRFRICSPDVMAGQLDRLAIAVGVPNYRFGIIPFEAQLPMTPFHGFWVYDRRLIKVETAAAELRIIDESEVRTYLTLWDEFANLAEYGPRAHQLIARSRAAVPEM